MFETYKCKIPAWALSYLINGDESDLTEADLKLVRDWEVHWGCPISISVIDESPYFSSSPEFGLPCDVEDCEVLIEKADN